MSFRIGVCGPIGSGKSTIARMLSSIASAPIIDADKIARDVVVPGTPTLKAIVDEFGQYYLDKDGTLNRYALGKLIFSSIDSRQKLNEIMFPAITARVNEQFALYEAAGEKYVIYDAPLLYDSGMDKLMDYIMVIVAPYDVIAKRLKERNNYSKEEIDLRLSSQMPLNKLLLRPHDMLISNNLKRSRLKAIITSAWREMQKKSVKADYKN